MLLPWSERDSGTAVGEDRLGRDQVCHWPWTMELLWLVGLLAIVSFSRGQVLQQVSNAKVDSSRLLMDCWSLLLTGLKRKS